MSLNSPRFNKDKIDFENLNVPIFVDDPVAIDLEELLRNNNLIVSGSPSYNQIEYQPIQAINGKQGYLNKFGGVFPNRNEKEFVLTFEFPKKPVVIDGYAIQTADDEIYP
jgi:hypothetical protein